MTASESDSPISVMLPAGAIEVSAVWRRPPGAWAALALAHGAGAGHLHPFLAGFADGLEAEGVATLRFAFPYAQAGRRMPGPAGHAVATWIAVMADLAVRAPDLAHWAAGKSYGGRMASMAAAEAVISPAGLVYLGYPLHPPGDAEKARVAHLPDIPAPQLFVEGTNDPFIDPHDQLRAAVESCQDAEISWVEGGGHSFEVKGSRRAAEDVGRELAPRVAQWLRRRG